MLTLLIGGSSSGKSKLAEEICMQLEAGEKYYIATMKIYDAEMEKKVEKHKKQREGKSFITLECEKDISRVVDKIPSNATVLLECMSNLLANEMFDEKSQYESIEQIQERIMDDILLLNNKCKNLIIVSNNVFEDGTTYDEMTGAYVDALGFINQKIASIADNVTKVVVGIPVIVKGEKICSF